MTTMKKNLIIPEVVGEVADSHFGERMTLLPVTRVDTTLEGVPGEKKNPCGCPRRGTAGRRRGEEEQRPSDAGV